jgi:hypothetical protein
VHCDYSTVIYLSASLSRRLFQRITSASEERKTTPIGHSSRHCVPTPWRYRSSRSHQHRSTSRGRRFFPKNNNVFSSRFQRVASGSSKKRRTASGVQLSALTQFCPLHVSVLRPNLRRGRPRSFKGRRPHLRLGSVQ